MTQNATQAKKSRSFTVGVSFRLSPYYSLLHSIFTVSQPVQPTIQFNNQKHNAPFFNAKQDYIITVLLFLFAGTILSFHLLNRSIDLGTIHVFTEQI